VRRDGLQLALRGRHRCAVTMRAHDTEYEGPVDVLAPRDGHESPRKAGIQAPGRRSRVRKDTVQPERSERAGVLSVDGGVVRLVDVDRRVGDVMALSGIVTGVARRAGADVRRIGLLGGLIATAGAVVAVGGVVATSRRSVLVARRGSCAIVRGLVGGAALIGRLVARAASCAVVT